MHTRVIDVVLMSDDQDSILVMVSAHCSKYCSVDRMDNSGIASLTVFVLLQCDLRAMTGGH